MSRIYGNIEEIDSEKIKKFFNNRAKKDEEALLVKTEFSDKENVEKRQKEESELLLNKIDFENKKIMNNKDIKIVNIDKIVKVQVVLWLIKKRMYYKMFVKIVKRVLLIEPAF